MHKITSTRTIRRYAIGDLHGCISQAREALEWCAADAGNDSVEAEIILLGDYVDKGPDSRAVIDMLIAGPKDDHVTWIALRGNHDDLLQRVWFDHAAEQGAAWWEYGGQETMISYGWDPLRHPVPGHISEYVPQAHADFLRSLPVMYETDELIFVHAGLRPGVTVADQSERDLLWIRGAFLDHSHAFGKPVVHGHSPDRSNPLSNEFRVSLDTACFGSGKLAIARFEPGEIGPTFKVIRGRDIENALEEQDSYQLTL
jgi:serine/threonine protein phosphatase 1